jgi:carboxylesterase
VQRRLRRAIAEADRDPITSVIRGTEAITLAPAAGDPATSRTACLMVHGFLSARTDFADLGERLVRHGITVRLMRLPGHGTTPVDFAYLPPGALYKAVHQEYLNLRERFDRIYLVGFSMGGSLSTILASEEPVDRLVLVSPYFGVTYAWYYVLPAHIWNALLGRLIPYVVRTDAFVKLNDRTLYDKIFMYKIVPTAGVRQLKAIGQTARREELLRKVACSVLIVHSRGDGAASPQEAQEAFGKLGSSDKEILWLKESNHIVFWDFEREEAKDRIERFLTEPRPSRPEIP